VPQNISRRAHTVSGSEFEFLRGKGFRKRGYFVGDLFPLGDELGGNIYLLGCFGIHKSAPSRKIVTPGHGRFLRH
jgi:hypothetical protein